MINVHGRTCWKIHWLWQNSDHSWHWHHQKYPCRVAYIWICQLLWKKFKIVCIFFITLLWRQFLFSEISQNFCFQLCIWVFLKIIPSKDDLTNSNSFYLDQKPMGVNQSYTSQALKTLTIDSGLRYRFLFSFNISVLLDV